MKKPMTREMLLWKSPPYDISKPTLNENIMQKEYLKAGNISLHITLL
jgi:hypothetical protein